MARPAVVTRLFCLALLLASAGLALSPDQDFTGQWVLDSPASTARSLDAPVYLRLAVAAQDAGMSCTADADGAALKWSYAFDRSETSLHTNGETWSSVVKWEGAALLVNTLVSGRQSYTVMDRWTLSRDRSTLTIHRQLIAGVAEREGFLIYRREGQEAAQPAPVEQAKAQPVTAAVRVEPATPPLVRRPEPPAPAQFTVPSGTRIALSLRTLVDTKHSHEGDRVYLDTLVPVTEDNRIIIPRGSYVTGTILTSKSAGTVKKPGELFIRFDSLTLPNGVTRDFTSHVGSTSGVGKVDPKEGKITGERDRSHDARTAAEGAGIGVAVGSVAGAVAHAPLAGAGIGAAAGAAAGIAAALHKHKADVALQPGTTIEMVLDRDLLYSATELR